MAYRGSETALKTKISLAGLLWEALKSRIASWALSRNRIVGLVLKFWLFVFDRHKI